MPETNAFGQPVGEVVPGWEPRQPPAPVTLTGRYVTVAPLSSAQYADLYAAVCGPEDDDLWTYRAIEKPTSLPELWMHLAGILEQPDQVTFALTPQGRHAEGIATYARLQPAHGQIEVAGVLLARTLQRTPAATEAIHLLLRHAFDDLGYRRFEWKCDSLNEPSRRAAARLGFRYEGRFRHHLVVKGRNRDTDWFSITDAEWAAVREAHEQWLDPANFDDSGRQRSSLSALTS